MAVPEKGDTMERTATAAVTARTKVELLTSTYTLPMLLGVNTLVLLAVDQLGGIPSWIKAAATLFLAF